MSRRGVLARVIMRELAAHEIAEAEDVYNSNCKFDNVVARCRACRVCVKGWMVFVCEIVESRVEARSCMRHNISPLRIYSSLSRVFLT